MLIDQTKRRQSLSPRRGYAPPPKYARPHRKNGGKLKNPPQETSKEETGGSVEVVPQAYHAPEWIRQFLNDTRAQSKGAEQRKLWKCQECRKLCKAGSSTQKESDDSTIATVLRDINRRLDELLPLKKVVQEMEESLNMMAKKYDTIGFDVVRHNSEIKNLKNRMSKLEEVGACAEIKKKGSCAVNAREYRSRKLNIELHGIQKTHKGCLMSEVNAIASKLQLAPLTEQSVSAIHRLPSRSDKITGIVIRFSNQSTRDQ
ncbi:hypothetical protein HPB49_012440 [Dermacentor silvarum]|uniref:Uncharacterized protein n=1 Tax=Dermacentor silvarum TaxID=543639 RepID=A0ACB8C9A2_DERSI|nr:hypothetical protein HPB49_012440 [Dermacentor silvarum]